jgi:hypothetical protein
MNSVWPDYCHNIFFEKADTLRGNTDKQDVDYSIMFFEKLKKYYFYSFWKIVVFILIITILVSILIYNKNVCTTICLTMC